MEVMETLRKKTNSFYCKGGTNGVSADCGCNTNEKITIGDGKIIKINVISYTKSEVHDNGGMLRTYSSLSVDQTVATSNTNITFKNIISSVKLSAQNSYIMVFGVSASGVIEVSSLWLE